MTSSNHLYAQTVTTSPLSDKGTNRIKTEIPTLRNNLPCSFTNSAFVRMDTRYPNLMKILIMGSEDTPYAHGAYEFDLIAKGRYPLEPPQMTLKTTANGIVRFNPNLYNTGYVCLSLLGTWRGQNGEN